MISMTFPVLLVIAILAAARSNLVDANNVILFTEYDRQIDVGQVLAQNTTVGEFKKLVAQKTKLDIDRVRLTTKKDHGLLDDASLLSDYMPINEGRLSLKLRDDLSTPGEIYVDTFERRIDLVATEDKTVGWLKKEALPDCDTSLYRVFYNGVELLDESKTLGQMQFYRGAFVILFKNDDKFRVVVERPGGSTIEFDATPETSVKDLKQMIENAGIDLSGRLLLHLKNPLHDNNKLFTYSKEFPLGLRVKIVQGFDETGGKVYIYYKKRDLVGHFWVHVKPSTTVGELKRLANNIAKEIPVEKMKLIFGGQLLADDSRELSEFNIFPEAHIEMNSVGQNLGESTKPCRTCKVERQL